MGNFQGYPSLLRQIKHRVSFAQQKAMYAGNTIKLYPTRKTNDNIFCTVE
jgi:hypothetical protein